MRRDGSVFRIGDLRCDWAGRFRLAFGIGHHYRHRPFRALNARFVAHCCDRVSITWAAVNSAVRVTASPERDMLPRISRLSGLRLAGRQPEMGTNVMRPSDAGRIIDRRPERRRGPRSDAGDGHDASATLVIPGQGNRVRCKSARAVFIAARQANNVVKLANDRIRFRGHLGRFDHSSLFIDTTNTGQFRRYVQPRHLDQARDQPVRQQARIRGASQAHSDEVAA